MTVSVDLIKQLRELTNAPLKDCKEALVDAQGDMAKAQEILKEKGVLAAAKKADRETNEGVVRFKKFPDGMVVGVKIVCETDFVTKTDTFQEIVEGALTILHDHHKEFASFDQIPSDVYDQVDKLIKDNLVKLGENIKFVDGYAHKEPVMFYNHPGDRVSAALVYESSNAGDETIARELCLQVAAMAPSYTSMSDIPRAEVDELKKSFVAELADSKKPQNIIDTIVEGRINKHFSEMVLTEQGSIRDESKKVKDTIPATMKLISFVRFAI